MKRSVLFLFLALVVVTKSSAQTDSLMVAPGTWKSDKGHWLAVRVGAITGGSNIVNDWIILGGYEGRFSKNWSVPLEFMAYNDYTRQRSWFNLSAALKIRFPILNPATSLYAQAGIGSGGFTYAAHYAVGSEYGVADRLSLYLQAKRFTRNLDIQGVFVSIGVNINATSKRLRQKYEEEKGL